MSASTAAMYPTLGFDPTPGDEAAARAATGVLRDTGAALEQISHVLHGTGAGAELRGQAIVAFQGLMDEELRPKIDTAWHSFTDSLRALEEWAGFVPGAQTVTRRLEREAADLLAQITATRSTLGAMPPAPPPGEAAPEDPGARQRLADEGAERTSLSGQIDGLEQQLDELREQARRHGEDYVERAEDVARRLGDAIDAAPNEPGFWASVGDAFGDALGALADVATAIGEAVIDGLAYLIDNLAPILQTIGDVAGMLSTVCGLLALVPGLQFLGPVALILAGVALGTHYLAAAKAHGSFVAPFTDAKSRGQLLTDAAGLVVGIGAAKAATSLTRVSSVGETARMVPQLIGPAQKVPYNFFRTGARAASMSTAEFGARAVKYHADAAAHVITTVGIPNVAGTTKNWTRGQFGDVPMEDDAKVEAKAAGRVP